MEGLHMMVLSLQSMCRISLIIPFLLHADIEYRIRAMICF